MLSPGLMDIFGNCRNSLITRATGWYGLMEIRPALPHWNFNVAGIFCHLFSAFSRIVALRPTEVFICFLVRYYSLSHALDHFRPLIRYWLRRVALLAEHTNISINSPLDIAIYFGSRFPYSVRSAFLSLTFFRVQRVVEMVWSGHWHLRMSKMVYRHL